MDDFWLPVIIKCYAEEMVLVFKTAGHRALRHQVVAQSYVGKAADWFSGLELPFKNILLLLTIKTLNVFPDLC